MLKSHSQQFPIKLDSPDYELKSEYPELESALRVMTLSFSKYLKRESRNGVELSNLNLKLRLTLELVV